MNHDISHRIFRRSPNVIFRKVSRESILVPIAQEAIDLEALFSLNETGARIWELLDGTRGFVDLVSVLAQDYHQDQAQVQEDIVVFLSQLLDLKFIEVVNPAD